MSDLLHIHQLFLREPEQQVSVGLHVHRLPQLYACVQGRIAVRIEGEAFALRHGEGVLVPPGQGRELRRGRGPSAYLVAIVRAPELDLDGAWRRRLVVTDELRADFSALVAELRTIGRSDSPLLCRTLLLRLLLGFRRQAWAAAADERGGETEAGSPVPERLVRQVERVMEQNLHRPLSRRAIAAAVQLSEPHLARLYRQATGTSLHRRLTELRVDQARRLLADSTLGCAQIAAEVGFASVSHFGKVFRAATGLSPGGYRRRHGL